MRNQISVLITGVGGGGVGEQCMQALRSSDIRYRIIGTDTNPMSIGLLEADSKYIVPTSNDERYMDVMRAIIEKEKPDVLIPGSEPELVTITLNKKLFEDLGIVVLTNPMYVIEICQNKWKTYQFLTQNNFHPPKSWIVTDIASIPDVEFPVIIKPVLGGGGSKNTYLAQDDEELIFFTKYIMKQNQVPLIQEYVGSIDDEFTVGVLTSLEGDMLGSIALHRFLKSHLSLKFSMKKYTPNEHELKPIGVSSGISQGEVSDYPEICEFCESVALKLGARGPINIQCRKDGDKIRIFEINPRFSGTTSIRALLGYNEPDTLIRKHILGEKIDRMKHKNGIILRGLRNYYLSYQLRDSMEKCKAF